MALVLSASLTGYSSSASANDPIDVRPAELIELPSGVIVDSESYRDELPKIKESVRGGDEFKCYRSEEYSTVVHMAVDYRWFWRYSIDLENVIKLKDMEIQKTIEKAALYQVALEGSKDSLKYMSDVFDREHRARLDGQGKEKLMDILKTTAIGVEAALIVGLGTALLIVR